MSPAVVASLGQRFGLVSPALIALIWELVWKQLHVWRLVTNFVYFGAPSFNWLWHMFFMCTLIPAYESDCMPSGGGGRMGNAADFLWQLIVCGLMLLASTAVIPSYFLAQALFISVVYVWSKRAGDTPISFYMVRIPARYLPWAMVALGVIIGGDIVTDLLGIAVGHLYYFLQEELPSAETPLKGYRLLRTPNMLYSAMRLPPTHDAAVFVHMRAQQAAGAAPAGAGPARNYFQGQGRVVGRD